MIFTIPNAISLARILAIPYLAWLLLGADEPIGAAWVLGAIAWTDWIDGYLARRLDQVSELGKVLDPLADRLTVGVAVIGGWISAYLPWGVALAILVREAMVATGALVLLTRARARLDVRYLGKVATFGVYFALPFFYFWTETGWAWHGWVAWGIGIPSLVMYYWVAFQYVGDMRRILAGAEPVSSGEQADRRPSP